MTQSLLIAGGSVRAAAESAIRAGFAPWCVDCFGDVDLVRACPTRVVRDYPKEIPEILASGPAGCGWMYTGSMENHPEIIAAVDRPLYGNPDYLVRYVREPHGVVAQLRSRGFPFADYRCPFPGRALVKPLKSGGGLGIRIWNGEPVDPDRHHLQELIVGDPMSAVILGGIGQSELVAQTRQLTGLHWLHAPGVFHYCGSIYDVSRSAEQVGSALSWSFRLTGLFGVDGIVRDGVFVPIEVNPRYTASIEIVERAHGRNLVYDHLRHFKPFDHELPPSAEQAADLAVFPGKAILYAPVDFTFPATGPWDDDYPFADLRRRFADLPHPGAHIRRGQPVLTFFADGDSPVATEAALRKIAADLDRLLFGR